MCVFKPLVQGGAGLCDLCFANTYHSRSFLSPSLESL